MPSAPACWGTHRNRVEVSGARVSDSSGGLITTSRVEMRGRLPSGSLSLNGPTSLPPRGDVGPTQSPGLIRSVMGFSRTFGGSVRRRPVPSRRAVRGPATALQQELRIRRRGPARRTHRIGLRRPAVCCAAELPTVAPLRPGRGTSPGGPARQCRGRGAVRVGCPRRTTTQDIPGIPAGLVQQGLSARRGLVGLPSLGARHACRAGDEPDCKPDPVPHRHR